MKLSNLEFRLNNGTPKQLLNHLKNYGWRTKEIIDDLVDYKIIENKDYSKYTNLNLCEMFQEEIVDFIIEDYGYGD